MKKHAVRGFACFYLNSYLLIYVKKLAWSQIVLVFEYTVHVYKLNRLIMQKIFINKLFENKNFIRNYMIEPNSQIALDFTNVNEIRMNDIQRLIDLQKMAIFNDISLKVENLEPDISKILEQTGLYKTLNTIGSLEKSKFCKRLGLAVK